MNRIRIPKSWILLAVIIVSTAGAGAYVFTTPPNGLTNQTGSFFGNTSNNANNYTSDRINVMNYFGYIVGTYIDSYSCEGTYCVYRPWYSSGNIYVKNMSDGTITSDVSASSVIQNIISIKTSNISFSFAPGTYSGFHLNLTTNNIGITLKSSQYKGAILTAIDSNPIVNISCDVTGQCRDNMIKDFWIDGGNVSGANAIVIHVGRLNRVEHNYFSNISGTAINVSGTATQNPFETRIKDNDIDNYISQNEGTQCGIYFDSNSNDGYIESNVVNHFNSSILSNTSCGIFIGGRSHYIAGNHVWSDRDGIILNDTATSNKVIGNYLDGNGIILNGSGNIIVGNQFYNSAQTHGQAAIQISSTSAFNNTIYGNMLDNTGTAPAIIFIDDVNSNQKSGNVYIGATPTDFYNDVISYVGSGALPQQTIREFSSGRRKESRINLADNGAGGAIYDMSLIPSASSQIVNIRYFRNTNALDSTVDYYRGNNSAAIGITLSALKGNISLNGNGTVGGASCITMYSPDHTAYRFTINNGGTTAITAGVCDT